MKTHKLLAFSALFAGSLAFAQQGFAAEDPDARAAETESQMTPGERKVLTYGLMAVPFGDFALPEGAVPGAGYVAGIERLGVPPLTETDASLGVSYAGGVRKDGATALPSGMALGSTWNPELMRKAGAMIGGEARAKGFNVMLAGSINLIRDPRNGRTFEYLGEDPLHSGLLGGAAVAGIQSVHVISTLKHFALNGQETGRHFVDVKIGDGAARESDLLAFEIAIERGDPGSVMCAYNLVKGAYTCDSDYLLNKVLKQDWGFKGWVMSDWGAVPGLEAAMNGLDQQSGAQIDKAIFFGEPLSEAAATDKRWAERLSDMNRRILRSIYAVGVDKHPPVKQDIDFAANGDIAQETAEQGIVLLRNRGGALPLAKTVKRIAVIGGFANDGVLSGGGSSQVQGLGGPIISVPLAGADSIFASIIAQNYHRSSPLKAIGKLAPEAKISYRDGRYVADAVIAAEQADVAIVFATQWMTEGFDVPDLSLPSGQDSLIAAVAKANPNTIVVLETGGPVAMPWLEKTAAVLAAWYPGARGGDAIARIIFGDVNPSGRLPVTFPASVAQLPRPELDGARTVEPSFVGVRAPGQVLTVDYDIEGSDIGYRWFARKKHKALFPFGFGLSYTEFEHGALSLARDGERLTATFRVANKGLRAGAEVAQVYLISGAGEKKHRLAGFQRVELAPGESREVSVTLEPRILAEWEDGKWRIAAGRYAFALGKSAEDLGAPANIALEERSWGY